MISKTHTLDGVEVVPGLRVWDYDLRPRIVGEIRFKEADGDPWYNMIDPSIMATAKEMNPSRMWFRHPTTQEKA